MRSLKLAFFVASTLSLSCASHRSHWEPGTSDPASPGAAEARYDRPLNVLQPSAVTRPSKIAEGAPKEALDDPAHETQLYTCSMHPEIQQDHPGNCPKCGMTLVPKDKGDSQKEAQP